MYNRFQIPKILSKYILIRFFKALALTLSALTLIYLLVEFFERIDNLIAQKLPFRVMIEYLAIRFPQIVFQILPVAILMSTLLVLGGMARDNELIASFSGGISPLQVILPLIIVFVLLSILSGVYGELWGPALSEGSFNRLAKIKGEKPIQKLSEGKIWFAGRQGRFFNIQFIDFKNRGLMGITLFEVDERFQLKKRWEIKECYYKENFWEISDCKLWEFKDDISEYQILKKKIIEWPEEFKDFTALQKSPSEMSYLELRDYISNLEDWGYKIYIQKTDLYFKLAFPLACLMFGLLAIPFAIKLTKGVRYISIGLSLIASFIYWVVMHMGVSMGHAGILPPFIGAWAGNIIFAFLILITAFYIKP